MDAADLGKPLAVLVDMDGTLVDSDAAVARAWVRWADIYQVDADRALAIAPGIPADATARALRPDLPPEEVAEAAAFQLSLQYEDLADVEPTPGAIRLVATLQRLGVPWAVVTSADRRLARARLGAAGIAPVVLVTVEDVRRGKPHPEGYVLAADLLGVPADRCLVVEDSAAGAAAGRSAGAVVAGVKGIDADVTLEDLGELADAIEGWFQ